MKGMAAFGMSQNGFVVNVDCFAGLSRTNDQAWLKIGKDTEEKLRDIKEKKKKYQLWLGKRQSWGKQHDDLDETETEINQFEDMKNSWRSEAAKKSWNTEDDLVAIAQYLKPDVAQPAHQLVRRPQRTPSPRP